MGKEQKCCFTNCSEISAPNDIWKCDKSVISTITSLLLKGGKCDVVLFWTCNCQHQNSPFLFAKGQPLITYGTPTGIVVVAQPSG